MAHGPGQVGWLAGTVNTITGPALLDPLSYAERGVEGGKVCLVHVINISHEKEDFSLWLTLFLRIKEILPI